MIKNFGFQLFFSMYFRHVKVFYVNCGKEFQIKADTIYNKRNPTRLCSGFKVKLMVFMALTNCFCKNFTDFFRSAFISYTLCSPRT